MNRVARTKLGLLLIVLVVSFAAVRIIAASGPNVPTILILFLILLTPGRVQGSLFRDLLRGRRLLSAGQPGAALEHFERFLGLLRAEPWRQRLFWLSFSVYTPSAEAMTLNNIGAAHLGLGNLADADSALQAALAVDPLYPLPYYNRAVLAMVRGEKPEAGRLLEEARRLGYSAGSMDAVIRRAQALLAHVEGRGGN